MATGIGAVKQAFVRALRDISALTAAVGSSGIYEGVVPRNVTYPFVVYQVVSSVREYDWDDRSLMRTKFDVFVISDDQVEAHNLDALIVAGMHNITLDLTPSEQTSMLCRRVADLSFADLDDQSEKVYTIGGTYAVWTDQAM